MVEICSNLGVSSALEESPKHVLYRALMTAGVGLALSTGGAIYAGGSPKGIHWMQINIKLLRDGRHAIWDVNVFGPCSDRAQLGRAIGTTTSPPREPLLSPPRRTLQPPPRRNQPNNRC